MAITPMMFQFLRLFLLLGLLMVAGCLSDTPDDTDIPWNAPDVRDGMMPLPNSLINRYD